MKRFKSLIIGMAMLTLAFTGCASSTTSSQVESGQTVEETKEAETGTDATTSASKTTVKEVSEIVYKNEAGETVVSHKYGETIVPENPERIVSIKLEDLMLALDVDMVAARNFEGFYLEDQLNELGIGTIAVDEEANTINLEQVLSYKPDLIVIRDSFDQAIYDELSKIAPTIAFDLKTPTTSLLALGEALGMADKATERLEAYGETIENAKEALKDVDGEVAMLRIMKKEIRLYPYSTNDMSKFLYEDLGLTAAPMVIEYDKADSLAISMELLPDLTAEHIFLIAGYGSNTAEAVKESQERYEAIKADALWQSVPAVQKGNIYEVDSRVWLTHGILATEMKIADVLEHLAK
ncbi:MAG: ABC transporter substrate-binding protein [Candidatus Niameybacter stercoravium]|nr:ABC transporter substrate-binding protein [Candidatus Niameybacter stercoravium]